MERSTIVIIFGIAIVITVLFVLWLQDKKKSQKKETKTEEPTEAEMELKFYGQKLGGWRGQFNHEKIIKEGLLKIPKGALKIGQKIKVKVIDFKDGFWHVKKVD